MLVLDYKQRSAGRFYKSRRANSDIHYRGIAPEAIGKGSTRQTTHSNGGNWKDQNQPLELADEIVSCLGA